MKEMKLSKLIGVLCAAGVVILGVFLMLNREMDNSVFSKREEASTEAMNILAKDIDRNYPATQREVVQLFSRISKCYYNEPITEGELEELAQMQRKLFDTELLENNPLEDYIKRLKAEVKTAKENKETIVYIVQKQSSVKTWELDGDNMSSIIACYTVKKESYTKTYEEFLLREDTDGRWKIVGWRLTEPIDIE